MKNRREKIAPIPELAQKVPEAYRDKIQSVQYQVPHYVAVQMDRCLMTLKVMESRKMRKRMQTWRQAQREK